MRRRLADDNFGLLWRMDTARTPAGGLRRFPRRLQEAIAGDLVNTIASLALQTAMTVFYLAVMLRYSPLLTAVGLSALTGNVWVSGIISAKRVNTTREAFTTCHP